MRTSIITLLAITATTAVAQSNQYLVTREEIGDALVDLYIREAPAERAQVASQILPVIKHDPRLLARYAEADPSFKSFMKKIGHGLKKVGGFALKNAGKVMDVAQKVAPMAAMVVRDTEWVDTYGNSLDVREFDDLLEAREYEDQFEVRDIDGEVALMVVRDAEWVDMYNVLFEAREVDGELYAGELS